MKSADPAMLTLLLRARRFDEKLLEIADEIPGHWHVSIGFEATAAALAQVRQAGDFVMTNYRNHAHLACLGADLKEMFAEILGLDAGFQGGRSGSFHLAAPSLGVLHTSAMVSGGVPLALGLAFAAKRRGDGICFCFFGDGAFNEGTLHESLNLAGLWSLPVLFVCENNAPPTDSKANEFQAARSLLELVRAHGIEGETVDGRRPAQVLSLMQELAVAVRGDGRPRYLEAQVDVWPGNRTFFPRDVTGPTDLADAGRVSLDPWKDHHDPVLNEARRLLDIGVEVDDLARIDASVCAEIDAAFAAARSAPLPDPDGAISAVHSS